jgi:CRP-like cAMP-binding protein
MFDDMPTIKERVQLIPYFQGIRDEELGYLTAHSTLKTFSSGEAIFIEGDVAKGLWIVESGRVKIFKVNPAGDEHILHLRAPYSTFNDIAVLDGGNNPANATALYPQTQVWLVPSDAVTYILMNNPQVALNVVRMLAKRVRSLVSKIEDLALYSVIVRLARFLLKQADDPNLSGVTRTTIASHLNTTPQTISVVLRELETAGAILFDRHKIVIVDEESLRSIALL